MYLDISNGKLCKAKETENGVKLNDGVYVEFSTGGFDNKSVVVNNGYIDITNIVMSDGSYIDVHIVKGETDIVLARLKKEAGMWLSHGTLKEYTDTICNDITTSDIEGVCKVVNTVLDTNGVVIDKSKLSVLISYIDYITKEPVHIDDAKLCADFGVSGMAFNDVPMSEPCMKEKEFKVGNSKFRDIVNHIKELAESKVLDSIIVSQGDTCLVYAGDLLNSPKIKVSTYGDIIDTFVKLYEMNKEG